MRIARIATPSGPVFATGPEGGWVPIEDPFAAFQTGRPPRAIGDAIADAVLLAPVAPTLVVGIAQPADPGGQVRAWLKSPRTVVPSGVDVPLRRDAGRPAAEGEVAVVIGRSTSGLTAANAHEFALGVTAVNDVSNPDRGAPDERNFEVKGGTGYTPLGPWIETAADFARVTLTLAIDGVERVRTGSDELPASIADCLAYVAHWIELGPGDVVMCGAPRAAVAIDVRPGGTVVEVDVAGARLTTRFV